MEDIVLEKLDKAYGEKHVLSGLTLRFPAGKASCVMAPSGAGKTTLLRLLMGLEKPDAGRITGLSGVRLAAVFQEDRLLERLSAVENLRFVTPSLRREAALEALEAFGLDAGSALQPARELSGGMKRRVALVRALLADWDVLLLDEPFGGLDVETRGMVMAETRRRIAGRTVILVTHDPAEAVALDAGILQLPLSGS